jgi:hypothetical protein
VAPDGITQVVAPAPGTIFTANSGTAFGAFNSQIVSFTIPSGMSQSVFLDPYSKPLSFTMSYTQNKQGVVNGTNSYLFNLLIISPSFCGFVYV